MAWFTPGHCEDIDGGQNHLPGQCPGAITNCSGDCCGLSTSRSHGPAW